MNNNVNYKLSTNNSIQYKISFLFSFNGRTSRLNWWFFQITCLILSSVLLLFYNYLSYLLLLISGFDTQSVSFSQFFYHYSFGNYNSDSNTINWFEILLDFISSYLEIALGSLYIIATFNTIKRLHDTNRSGFHYLWILLPIVGWIYIIIICGFFKSYKQVNIYDTLPN